MTRPFYMQANSGPTFFKNTADFTNGWRKFLPTDQTSPHWYQPADLERLVYANIAAGRNGGRALTLRDLVRQFRGLTGSAKAKLVCDQFPSITTLAYFENAPEQLGALLDVMQINAASPKPSVLGYIGADHFRQCFEAHGLHDDRFWYKKADITLEGIPYLIEVAVGQTDEGRLYHGVNFSPTFNDPLSNSRLWTERFYSEGLLNFLHDAHCDPAPLDGQGHEVAVAVHLVSPSFQFLDRGKTRLSMPLGLNKAISVALWAACKTLFKEGERRKRDAARHERLIRSYSYRQAETSVKDAVFQVLPDAIMAATGGTYPVGARDLYYQTRPLIQKFTSKELEYNYFSQNLLTEYQQINGPIELLYYDPRGTLFEPHTGNTIPIGTREVEQYSFPEWTFNKILYIDKKGRTPILQAAKIPERYDLAIIGAEGYATEAARLLFQKADRDQRYQLFVLHDADAHGYNIARTLREETKRMPGYCVDVIDLGLFLQDALEMGLETENFTRQKQLPTGLVLSDLERKYFEGRQEGRRQWIAQRIELNALTAPQLVEYVERKLTEAGANSKVLPPKKIVSSAMVNRYEAELFKQVENEIKERINIAKIVKTATAQIAAPVFDAGDVGKGLEGLPPISWRNVVNEIVDKTIKKNMQNVRWREVIKPEVQE